MSGRESRQSGTAGFEMVEQRRAVPTMRVAEQSPRRMDVSLARLGELSLEGGADSTLQRLLLP